MLNGGIVKKILRFTLPLMLSGLLQALYSAADLLVIGQWADGGAVASVGATISVYSIIINLFMGLSVGVDVCASRAVGTGDEAALRRTIDTAVFAAVLVGVPVTLLGIGVSEPLLVLMNTPREGGVLDGAALYMRVCFIGVPFLLLYNFCAAVLRARGETRRPFLYLTISGVVNVGLNLFFVAVCGLSVLGVALGTVISQALSASLIFIDLCRSRDAFSFSLRRARFSPSTLWRMMRVGLPAGLQTALFSISNSFLQSGVNSLGDVAIAGSAAAEKLEELIWVSAASFQYAAVTFVSQNAGARKYDRVRRIALVTPLMGVITALLVGWCLYLLRTPLFSVFIPDNPAAMAYAVERASITYPLYFIAGCMAVAPALIQGLGYNALPAAVNVVGICVFRVIWRFTVFPRYNTIRSLFLVYPITWTMVSTTLILALLLVYRAVKRRYPSSP